MPQLDPSHFISQIVWLVAVFALLYLFVKCYFFPSINRVIDARVSSVEGKLSLAQELSDKSEVIDEEIKKTLTGARLKAHKIHKGAKEECEATFADQMSELDAELSRKLQDSNLKMEKARRSLYSEMDTTCKDLAAAAIDKLLKADRRA